jgi:hypothetical protein
MNQTSHFSLDFDAEPVARLLRLFREQGDRLRFPDVDADKLGELESVVEGKRDNVLKMEEALAEAREALALSERDLLERAQKAHAYLTVFAAGDPELEEEVAQIKMKTAAPTRVGRKKRPGSKKQTEGAPSAPSNSRSAQTEIVPEMAAE